jgi:repressor LexA
MRGLTARQKEVLKFLEAWRRARGFSPSVREIAAHFGIQLNAVARHLRALERKGAIERAHGKARALAIVRPAATLPEGDMESASSIALAGRLAGEAGAPRPREASGDSPSAARFLPQRIPLVAVVPAGAPRAVEEQAGEFVELSAEWFGSGDLRAVRVSGDSMSGDAIRDGDIAIIRIQPTAEPGEIVAVRIAGEEVTLKRIRRRGNRWIDLVPSNPEYPVRRVPAKNVEIIGKLVGILRRSAR